MYINKTSEICFGIMKWVYILSLNYIYILFFKNVNS